uniref:Uncharacterized protein n=1 Tax=Hucho hucho TaxID=62062 RepID=A0A4W5LR82_9TELE
ASTLFTLGLVTAVFVRVLGLGSNYTVCVCACVCVQGCTKGPHNQEKPPEPVKPDVTSSEDKEGADDLKPKFNEFIISAPKPLESIRRPSPDEPMVRLQQKISPSLRQALEKLKLSEDNPTEKKSRDTAPPLFSFHLPLLLLASRDYLSTGQDSN